MTRSDDDDLPRLRNAMEGEIEKEVERLRFVLALYLRAAAVPALWGFCAFGALEYLTKLFADEYEKTLLPARLVLFVGLGAYFWALWATRRSTLAGKG